MVEVNLLPQSYRKQSEPSIWRNLTYVLIPLTVAGIVIPEVLTATRIGDLQRQVEALEGEMQALRPAKAEYDALMAEKTELEQVTAIATQLRAAKTYWVNDLAAFTRQLPGGSGVALTSMNMRPLPAEQLGGLQQSGVYSGKNVTREIELSGTAASQQAVVDFLRTFENSPNFGVNFRSLQSANAEPGAAAQTYTFNASVGIVAPTPEGTPAAQPAAGDAAPPAPPAGGPSSRRPAADTGPALAAAQGPAQGGSRVQ